MSEHSESNFCDVPQTPMDPILKMNYLFKESSNPKKVTLGVGAYRDEDGHPYILDAVQKIERDLVDNKTTHEYPPMEGFAEYRQIAAEIMFGADHDVCKSARRATSQSVSGSGALMMAFEFVKKFMPNRDIYTSNPSWGNHVGMLKYRFPEEQLKLYRYYDPNTIGLDYDGLIEDLRNAKKGSVIVMQPIAHNPTGIDPTMEQWQGIVDVLFENDLFPIVDCAYQGFVSGDLDQDAEALRFIAQAFFDAHREAFFLQSFSKNLGLYGERIGAIHAVCQTEEHAEAVLSQMRKIVRSMYSMPPIHGAHIVIGIASNPEYMAEWLDALRHMTERIRSMRSLLRDKCMEEELKRDPNTRADRWDHIVKQNGMFSFTGLSRGAARFLRRDYDIFILDSGRISISGLNLHNIDYVAQAIVDAAHQPQEVLDQAVAETS